MILSGLEKDILGDLQHDSHELWEWYSFIRTYYPSMPENEIIKLGYNLFVTWIEREWLVFYISRKNAEILQPGDFLKLVKSMGNSASNPEAAVTVLELSSKARKDVDWLRQDT